MRVTNIGIQNNKINGIPGNKKEAHVYIIAGQSNAQGYSDDSVLNNLYRSIIPRTYIYAKPGAYPDANSVYSPDNGEWQKLLYGTNHSLTDFLDHYGAELEFSYKMQEELAKNIYIVKAAWGDSALSAELSGGSVGDGGLVDWSPTSTLEYYNRLINYYCLRAKRDLEKKGLAPVFKSMLWMQGERDAFFTNFGAAYQTNLENFISAVRTSLNSPNMQFVIGRISDDLVATRTAAGAVRTASTTVSGQTNNVLIDTDSAQMKVDLVHYFDCSACLGTPWFNIAKLI